MKKQREIEWDAPARRKQHAGWLSDMRIRTRAAAAFGLAALTAAVMLVLSAVNVSRTEADQRDKLEQMVVSSAEQYISASVENITAIAQNLYSNESLLAFLNRRYSSSAEYYDAYFELRSNNSLSAAENRSISEFYIYTDNATILQGGDLYPVSSVQDEEWYKYFTSLNKSMILYCDSVERSLSLIQKLDYIRYMDGASGEAYLKMDLNTDALESYFDSLNFDGSMYVLSGGVVLYSNRDIDPDTIRITPDYYCVFRNYYTAPLEFYAAADRLSPAEVLMRELPSVLGFGVFFVLALAAALFVFRNLSTRTRKLCDAFEKGDLSAMRERVYAKDEIGRITELCVSMTDRMELMQRENNKSADLLARTRSAANSLLMHALNQDAGLRYTAYFADQQEKAAACMEFSHDAFSHPAPLAEELNRVSFLLKERKHFGSLQCEALPDDLYILPCAVLLIAEELMRQILSGTEEARLNISAGVTDSTLEIGFSANVQAGSTVRTKLIRLQAAFEDRPEQTDFTYEPQHPFNTCIRIKQYYGPAVKLCMGEGNMLSLTICFDRSRLGRDVT